MYSKSQLEALAAVLREPAYKHVWVISDEIYHQLVVEPDTPSPVCFATLPGMQARTIIIDGVSKAYAMTGFRLGWMIAPPTVAAACTKLQGQITSCASSVSQAVRAWLSTSPEIHHIERQYVANRLPLQR
jgi:aspartate/methionine/tyrosine aminotransferase